MGNNPSPQEISKFDQSDSPIKPRITLPKGNPSHGLLTNDIGNQPTTELTSQGFPQNKSNEEHPAAPKDPSSEDTQILSPMYKRDKGKTQPA